MSRSLRERSRLLALSARIVGLLALAGAILSISLPGALTQPAYPILLVVLIASGVLLALMPRLYTQLLGALALAAAAVAIMLIWLIAGDMNPALAAATVFLAGGVAPSVALVTAGERLWWLQVLVSAVVVTGLAALVLVSSHSVLGQLGMIAAAWLAAIISCSELNRLIPRTLARTEMMTHAYRVERAASEREARRRQDARLLHDTVLATLTLLAHSGVGVKPESLRAQAAEDSALLHQLRLGFDPRPKASGTYNLQPVEESALGNTLESVKHRFKRLGLDVKWHGSGQVMLPSEVLDAFLLALSECLENVRRHAKVAEANVTITDDDSTVRAMVTDAGVGFDVGNVDEMRLGFAESIVARLHDVGGKARLFSSPGAGTTVVLEVPK